MVIAQPATEGLDAVVAPSAMDLSPIDGSFVVDLAVPDALTS